ncbi:MAG TPA: (4Fe-4S)-binding protein [Ferruginibacter sp.]|nr:(4Fe-4S)-binding protein [Ferruginibacter sp.]HRE62324.1 (4Fe-4S)-binding protein [Ferruginibacter sp.]
MEEITKRYTNGELSIVWQPDRCIHSKKCWKGLPQVFNPNEKPWIKADAASNEAIIQQVSQCPSKALSYFMNNDLKANEDEVTLVENIVEVSHNGPLLIYGNIIIKDAAGAETKKHKVTALCRCGASANKPYCDGTHKKIDFKG